LRIIRDAEQKRMPWKNGGGETIEVCIGPDDSALDTFDWRVSRARINRSGPFSSFPGIDRTIVTLDGAGILLRFEGAAPVALTPGDPPLTFAGELRVEAEIINGIVTDLNVMTRRGHFHHRLSVLTNYLPTEVLARGNAIIAIFAVGAAILHTAAGKCHLSANDAALLFASDRTVSIVSQPNSRIFLIQIEPAATWKAAQEKSLILQ
jgi:hypothetical protein